MYVLNDFLRVLKHLVAPLELQDLFAPLALGVNESYELAVSAEGSVKGFNWPQTLNPKPLALSP